MADKVSIAIMRATAIKTILEESEVIAKHLGKEPPVFTERNRDPSYLQAVQLKEVSEWLKDVSEAIAPSKKAKATK